MPPNPLVNAQLRSPRAMQIPPHFQNILNPPPPRNKIMWRTSLHSPHLPLPPTYTQLPNLSSFTLPTPSLFPLPPHTQLPNLFSFFYPTSPSPTRAHPTSNLPSVIKNIVVFTYHCVRGYMTKGIWSEGEIACRWARTQVPTNINSALELLIYHTKCNTLRYNITFCSKILYLMVTL